jgi:hypothetical protein
VDSEKLIVDPDFVPCPVKTGDELFINGIFEFNISCMRKFIWENPTIFTPESVSIKDFYEEYSSINENHMGSVEISEPVILAEISPGRYNLIDGNHRVEKVRRLGLQTIMAYRLKVLQHLRFLTTKKAYVAFIEYWNNKL